ncbi:MAG: hypothetical protein US11_C0001G0105 [Candidatus Roizmanbacteria bacterium GW2011_GWA2_36_23]|uniref:Large ribosomal subunit protein uL29 n=1 Tax=Candidatus Roizmanbacteria bacterium GW2011_GWA2_36_23 TaxID=1618480 RepID=A0A0G0HE13_9BACT|nr:MAG: hypothetical protein US11_C0001G0105 [Candidatus Roizmanbacteria bacterium GW2011_GWA2_36_23]
MKKIVKELKNKSKADLEKQIQLLRIEISKLKLHAKVNPAKDTNLIRKKQKELARTLTAASGIKETEKLQISK